VFASASAIVAAATWASTYVFTAFWVGYKVVLLPKGVFALFETSSFNAKDADTSDAFALVASAEVTSAAFAF
jgi:hypothetical protein